MRRLACHPRDQPRVRCVQRRRYDHVDGAPEANGVGHHRHAARRAATTSIAAIVADVIVPGYQRLDAATEALQTAIDDLCAEPTDAHLATAQQAWRDARLAWSATRCVPVGAGDGAAGDVEDRLRRSTRRRSPPCSPAPIPSTPRQLRRSDPTSAASPASSSHCSAATGPSTTGRASTPPRRQQLVAAAAAALAADWEAGVDMGTPRRHRRPGQRRRVRARRRRRHAARTSGRCGHRARRSRPRSTPDRRRAPSTTCSPCSTGSTPWSAASNPSSRRNRPRPPTGSPIQLDKARTNIGLIPAPLATATDEDAITSAYRSTTAALLIARAEVASLLGVTLTLGDADGDS